MSIGTVNYCKSSSLLTPSGSREEKISGLGEGQLQSGMQGAVR